MPSTRSQEPTPDAPSQGLGQLPAPTECPADTSKDQFATLLRQLLSQADKQQNWLARKLQDQGIQAKEPTVSEWVNAKSLPRTDHAVLAIQGLLGVEDNRLLALWHRGQAARKAPDKERPRPEPEVDLDVDGASVSDEAQPVSGPTFPGIGSPQSGHGPGDGLLRRHRPDAGC